MSQKTTSKNQKTKSKNQHVTKISAKSAVEKSATNAKNPNPSSADKSAKIQPKSNLTKKANKAKSKALAKSNAEEKPLRQVFILARPFVAIGRYLRDSWRELRQVRWPNRGATWKMTLAVLIYCAIFIVFITLLDSFFTFIFNLLLNQS